MCWGYRFPTKLLDSAHNKEGRMKAIIISLSKYEKEKEDLISHSINLGEEHAWKAILWLLNCPQEELEEQLIELDEEGITREESLYRQAVEKLVSQYKYKEIKND